MIKVFRRAETDWSTNGLAILEPTSAVVTEVAGGNYELTLEHPIDSRGKWLNLEIDNVLRAPVPGAPVPAIDGESIEEEVVVDTVTRYKVHITTASANGTSRIYAKPDVDSNVLQKLPEGQEYTYLGTYNSSWHRARSDEGTEGYMWTANSQYSREMTITEIINEGITIPGVDAHRVSDQAFIIYERSIDSSTSTITVRARHISYWWQEGLVIGKLTLTQATCRQALDAIRTNSIFLFPQEYYTNIDNTQKINADYSWKSPTQALLDPDNGIVPSFHAKLIRDNFDVFILAEDDTDRGYTIEYGKNLIGVQYTENRDSVITRVIPLGRDENDEEIMHPDHQVDSDHLDDYSDLYVEVLDITDAKIGGRKNPDDPDDTSTWTQQEVYDLMWAEAEKRFTVDHADMPKIKAEVDFVHLPDTVEYAGLKNLQGVYLYDWVQIRHAPYGLSIGAQVIGYEWDAIAKRYTRITLGEPYRSERSTAGYDLSNGSINYNKLSAEARRKLKQ